MTGSAYSEVIWHRRVLLAHEPSPLNRRWHDDLDAAFGPAGLVPCRAHSGIEAVREVERGGLAAAVLFADGRFIDGLSLLGIIRSINTALPCWLVAEGANRWALQKALALRAASVLTTPVAAVELAVAIQKRIADSSESMEN